MCFFAPVIGLFAILAALLYATRERRPRSV